jgi:hypothetical protein
MVACCWASYTTGTLPTSWASQVSANRAVGHNVNFASSTDNNWYLTGVQLEVGDTATTFEHRSFAEEQTLCQRYYWQNEDVFVYGKSREADRHRDCNVPFPVEMRATPTVTKITDPSGFTGSWVHGGTQQMRFSGIAPSDGYVATCGTAKADAEL